MRSPLLLVASIVVLVFSLIACTQTEYPAISIEQAKAIKSGTSVEEIKKVLGEPHPPTERQQASLQNTIARMPEPMRANAEKDKSLAWGNDNEYFVAKVNDQGVAWVTSWVSSQK